MYISYILCYVTYTQQKYVYVNNVCNVKYCHLEIPRPRPRYSNICISNDVVSFDFISAITVHLLIGTGHIR